MKSIGTRLGKVGENQVRISVRLDKKQNEETQTSFTLMGTG